MTNLTKTEIERLLQETLGISLAGAGETKESTVDVATQINVAVEALLSEIEEGVAERAAKAKSEEATAEQFCEEGDECYNKVEHIISLIEDVTVQTLSRAELVTSESTVNLERLARIRSIYLQA